MTAQLDHRDGPAARQGERGESDLPADSGELTPVRDGWTGSAHGGDRARSSELLAVARKVVEAEPPSHRLLLHGSIFFFLTTAKKKVVGALAPWPLHASTPLCCLTERNECHL